MTLRLSRVLPTAIFAGSVGMLALLAGCSQSATNVSGDTPPAASIKSDRKASDSKVAASRSKITQQSDKPAEELDLSKVPEGDADELLAYLRKLAELQPEDNSREELAKFVKVQRAVIRAADKLLAEKDLAEEARLEGINEKWTAHSVLVRLDEPGAEEEFFKLTNELVNDKNAKVAKVARMVLRQREISISLRALMQGKSDRTDKLLEDLQAVLSEDQLGASEFQLVQQASLILESNEMYDAAGKVYAAMKQAFERAENPEVRSAATDTAEKGIRRLSLIGQKAELTSTQLNGEAFDLAEHKGKVVLVDFWATWCGPCKAELPNIKDNYTKYHDRGFEVVGISLDDDKQALEAFVADEKLPWVTLWTSLSADQEAETPTEHPLAKKFGVDGIPATYLIDQQGKVVALSVRGPRLGEKLAELLGAPDETDDDTTGAGG